MIYRSHMEELGERIYPEIRNSLFSSPALVLCPSGRTREDDEDSYFSSL